jgi:phage-related minor tail protein
MASDTDLIPITITADTGNLRTAMLDAERMAQGFGRAMTSAFEGAAVRGKSLGDVLRGLGGRLSDLALRAAMKPLESAIGGLFSNLTAGMMPFAKGGVVTPFASGGVVAAPTYFPMRGGGMGVMGEAGAEAIMPLARGADGRLGVRTAQGNGSGPVTVNISTPDAQSFRRSEAQVGASLARAVARGRRGL